MAERLHIHTPRVAQRRDEQVGPHALLTDLDLPLTKVDLQLLPRWRLKPDRRPRLSQKLPPQMRHRPLYRAQADPDPVLPRQLLTNHVRIAPMLPKALRQPPLQP